MAYGSGKNVDYDCLVVADGSHSSTLARYLPMRTGVEIPNDTQTYMFKKDKVRLSYATSAELPTTCLALTTPWSLPIRVLSQVRCYPSVLSHVRCWPSVLGHVGADFTCAGPRTRSGSCRGKMPGDTSWYKLRYLPTRVQNSAISLGADNAHVSP
eukprot:3934628-Rhodomonas_salina.2